MTIPKYLLNTILVIDTETATLGDHICEIGFSLFEDGKFKMEWGTFIKPIVPIEPEASAVHKIYDEDVEDAPTFTQIADYITCMLSMYDLHCAYNYEYDRGVLENEFRRIGKQFPLKPMLDPFILFKKWHKFNKGKKLTDAALKYGIQLVGAHRAMNDATATGKLLMKMAATKTTFPTTLDRYIKTQRKWIEEQFNDFYQYRKKIGGDLPTKPNYSYYEYNEVI